MLDVTLSILALIAGGVTMELFTSAKASMGQPRDDGALPEDVQTGNPS